MDAEVLKNAIESKRDLLLQSTPDTTKVVFCFDAAEASADRKLPLEANSINAKMLGKALARTEGMTARTDGVSIYLENMQTYRAYCISMGQNDVPGMFVTHLSPCMNENIITGVSSFVSWRNGRRDDAREEIERAYEYHREWVNRATIEKQSNPEAFVPHEIDYTTLRSSWHCAIFNLLHGGIGVILPTYKADEAKLRFLSQVTDAYRRERWQMAGFSYDSYPKKQQEVAE